MDIENIVIGGTYKSITGKTLEVKNITEPQGFGGEYVLAQELCSKNFWVMPLEDFKGVIER